ncbi:MAG: CaiB/BaiF CoA transferase family protein [Gammaproteobacteria bacterium]
MSMGSALAGLRVIDFSNQRTGAQVSQVLADFGADVIHVEPPGGSALRGQPAWPFWARGKRSLQLDLHADADRQAAVALAATADVTIETFRPGVAERLGLGYEQLASANPRLVHASITGFGRQGPLAGLQGYEGIVAAKLGVYWSLTELTRRPGPSFCSAAYASYPASQLALQGILAALYERERSGAGQRVETSLVQGLTVHDTFQWFTRVVAKRYPDSFAAVPRVVNGIPTGGLSFRLLIAQTRDGRWLQFSQTTQRLFRAMMKMFDLEWMFDDPQWKTLPDFDDVAQRVQYWEKLLEIVRSKTAAEWLADFDRDPNVWGEQFRRDAEVLDHPQMRFNAMVSERVDRDLGPIRSPGPIAHLYGTPAVVDRPAPRLGEHDAALRAETRGPAPAHREVPDPQAGALPLAGVTVVELGTYYAAPYGATLLAELGARVIKLEQLDGDPQRTMLPFPEIAGLKALQGKESLAVDLATPAGRAIAHRIIARADIVLQSFRAGAARRLGLDAETLCALNPRLIYHASPGYGEDGPYGHRPAFAPTIGAGAGLAWRNAGPLIPDGVLPVEQAKPTAMQLADAVMGVGNSDGLSAITAATAMLLGLVARSRGAGGQHQLTTMLSSVAHAISEVTVEYAGAPAPPTADAGLYGFSALYRLYEASDEWVFLAAPSPREWRRLADALAGCERLDADPRFATPEARRDHDAGLAQALARIFRTRPAAQWETDLRAADVACVVAARGPVEARYMEPGDVGEQCGLVTAAHHPILDAIPRLAPLVRFSRSGTRAGDACLTGQHTRQVLADFDYGSEEIDRLAAEGIIGLG